MRKVLFLFIAAVIAKPTAWAQAPAQPLKLYTGSFGGGFATILKPLVVLGLFAVAATAAAIRWFRV